MGFLRCCVLRRFPARAVEAFQSVLLYGMSHDGTAVAVVPVLMIRMMLTKDNQRCAGALECYQEAPELRVQGAGRDVVLKEVRLTLDGGARLHPVLQQRGGRGVPRSQAAR